MMSNYEVHVIIENKPGISDPEGETILNDLVLKGNEKDIAKIKTGKMLKFSVSAKDKNSAKSRVEKICDELRIYNPMVSKVTINVIEL
jgi:phosphoribosylformylglycinamidine synthase PurS subunit